MGDNLINTVKDKAYSTMEAAKYCGESQFLTYETYVIIFEKNMNILSSNNKLMRYARAVQKFLLGIKCPWFAAGTDFLTVLDAYKNDFAKNDGIFGQSFTTWQGRRLKYLGI